MTTRPQSDTARCWAVREAFEALRNTIATMAAEADRQNVRDLLIRICEREGQLDDVMHDYLWPAEAAAKDRDEPGTPAWEKADEECERRHETGLADMQGWGR